MTMQLKGCCQRYEGQRQTDQQVNDIFIDLLLAEEKIGSNEIETAHRGAKQSPVGPPFQFRDKVKRRRRVETGIGQQDPEVGGNKTFLQSDRMGNVDDKEKEVKG